MFFFCVLVLLLLLFTQNHIDAETETFPRVFGCEMVSAAVTEIGEGNCTQAELIKEKRTERRAQLQKHLLPQVNGEKSLKPQKRRRLKSASALQLLPAFTLTAKSEYTQVKLQLYCITKNVIQDSC